MNPKPLSVAEAARQTILRLASLRLPPTPENYARAFGEITGRACASVPDLPQILQRALETLAASEAELQVLCAGMIQDLQAARWEPLASRLVAGLRWTATGGTPALAGISRRLVREWERRQLGLSYLQKQEALEFILTSHGSEPAMLASELDLLLERWEALPGKALAGLVDAENLADAKPVPSRQIDPPVMAGAVRDMDDGLPSAGWRQLLGQALRDGIAPRLIHLPLLQSMAESLASQVGQTRSEADFRQLTEDLRHFWMEVELRHGEEMQSQQGCLRLLRLFTANVADLLTEDAWLHDQLEGMQSLLNEPPEPARFLQIEEHFKEIIYKQGILKKDMQEAREALKSMAGLVIASIEQISVSTGAYSQKVRRHADDLQNAENLDQINCILKDLLQDSAGIEAESRRLHDDLLSARDRLEQAEARIRNLESELDQMNHLVQEDPLTGALNRRGLEMALEKEIGRMQRQGGLLSIAALDLDHFKRLNDRFGHELGDRVLQHMVQILKAQLRPADYLARVGGEEFVIIFPDTAPESAFRAVARLRDCLAQQPLPHAGTTLLIQFSAGVTAWAPGEPPKDLLKRADDAMYEAKRAGRNQAILKETSSAGT